MEINNSTKWNPIQQKIGHMEKWYVQPHNVGNGDEITMNPYLALFWMGVYF
jgi:hypothetical protein